MRSHECLSQGRARRAEKEAPVAAVTKGKLGCAKQAPIPRELPGGGFHNGRAGSRRLPDASARAYPRIPWSARILRGLDASNRDETGTKPEFLGAHASCVAWMHRTGTKPEPNTDSWERTHPAWPGRIEQGPNRNRTRIPGRAHPAWPGCIEQGRSRNQTRIPGSARILRGLDGSAGTKPEPNRTITDGHGLTGMAKRTEGARNAGMR